MGEPKNQPINDADLQELKKRMKLITEADPSQYHNEFSLKRYLRAFKTVDDAFKVRSKSFLNVIWCKESSYNLLTYISRLY